jgi:lipopolysaccharide transport system ATP-binding protein
MTWSIQVENLSKRYKIGRGHTPKFDSLYQVITDGFLAASHKITPGKVSKYLPARAEKRPVEIQSEHLVLNGSQFKGAPEGEFWALRDVSFRIDEGQRVGIIGRNGSGKSTLLKILSRITSPTEGKYSYRGRLISLLEVGTGFHPDLSGRENIFLNAKINGMSDREIRRSFDAIVDFSELGAQIDTPIKRYSSGMYMRLAFSVAAHLESEILIVDEVLAVGDAGFQKKCMEKMLAIGNSGRTLLFVSHDMDAVRKICSVALELAHGRIVSHENIPNAEVSTETADSDLGVGTGLQSISTAISDYSLGGVTHGDRIWEDGDAPQVPSGAVAVRRVSLRNSEGDVSGRFVVGEEVKVCVELIHRAPCSPCSVRLNIASESGKALLTSMGDFDFSDASDEVVRRVICNVPAGLFNAGVFRVSLVVNGPAGSEDVYALPEVLDFEVVDRPIQHGGFHVSREAPLNMEFHWEQRKAGDE